MHSWCAVTGEAAGLKQVTVVVPLDEVDRVGIEDGRHPLVEEAPDLGPGQIKRLLVPLQLRIAVRSGREQPVGMRAEEIGVGIDHLGLEPDPEAHAEPVDVVDQGHEPIGPDGVVDPPVAQAGCVIAPVAEPAVVQDEQLRADAGSPVRDRLQAAETVIEVDRFPDIEDHRLDGRMGGKSALPVARAATSSRR